MAGYLLAGLSHQIDLVSLVHLGVLRFLLVESSVQVPVRRDPWIEEDKACGLCDWRWITCKDEADAERHDRRQPTGAARDKISFVVTRQCVGEGASR
jgi:hypothetical protein